MARKGETCLALSLCPLQAPHTCGVSAWQSGCEEEEVVPNTGETGAETQRCACEPSLVSSFLEPLKNTVGLTARGRDEELESF